jgi:hypothetical protein
MTFNCVLRYAVEDKLNPENCVGACRKVVFDVPSIEGGERPETLALIEAARGVLSEICSARVVFASVSFLDEEVVVIRDEANPERWESEV